MKGLLFIGALAARAAGALAVPPGSVALEGVHWQVGRVEGGRVAGWQDVKVLEDGPPKLDNRLRARLVLTNRGAAAEEGLLLRYAITARVGPATGAVEEGSWAVPMDVDEKRVPVIGADKMIDVPLDAGAALDAYVKRLARAGWWPDRLKIQVMLEPRPGAASIQIVEDILEIRRGDKQ